MKSFPRPAAWKFFLWPLQVYLTFPDLSEKDPFPLTFPAHINPASKYQTKLAIKFLFRQLMKPYILNIYLQSYFQAIADSKKSYLDEIKSIFILFKSYCFVKT